MIFYENFKRRISENRKEIILISILLFLTFLSRILFLDLTEYKGDEHYNFIHAKRILNGEFLLVGQEIGGSPNIKIYNSPLIFYVIALGMIFFGVTPEGAIITVVLFNTFAILFTYLTSKDMFGKKTGFIVSIIFCLAPWAFVYSLKIWPPSLMPFFTSVLIFSLNRSVNRGKKIYFFILGLMVGFCAQLHLTGFLIIPVVVLYLIIYRKSIIGIIIAILSAILAYLPLIINDLFFGGNNLMNFFLIFTNPSSTRIQDTSWLAHIFWTLTYFSNFTGGSGLKSYYNGQITTINNIFFLQFSFAIILLIFYLLKITIPIIHSILNKKRPEIEKSHFLILSWLIIPLSIQLFSLGAITPHYFSITFPVQFIAIGSLLSDWKPVQKALKLRYKEKKIKIKVRSLLILSITISQVFSLTMFYSWVYETGGIKEFGTTLGNKRRAIEWIINDSNENYKVDTSALHDGNIYQDLFKSYGEDLENGSPQTYYYILHVLDNRWSIGDRHQIITGLLEGNTDKIEFGPIFIYKTSIEV